MNRKPSWLRIKPHFNKNTEDIENILKSLNISTVCEEALCPNRGECFSQRTATFLIMGNNCTRKCSFCNVTKASPSPLDENEPNSLAKAVVAMGLKHVVITSVTRDDLVDGGASHFAKCVSSIRDIAESVSIELLIPDLKGDIESLRVVLESKPYVLNHNIETVPRLYSSVRAGADYLRSIKLLKNSKDIAPDIYTKSGIMLGLGESKEEVIEVLRDLRAVNCDFLTIGQYLAPSPVHHPVVEYVEPKEFEAYEEIGLEMGFKFVASSPFVRSSYKANEAIR